MNSISGFRTLLVRCVLAVWLCQLGGTAGAEQVEIPPLAEPDGKAYLSAELVYPLDNRPTPECHASTIVETPQGLVAAWFGGTREGHADVGIWTSRHDGQNWSRPSRVADGSEGEDKDHPCWNPVLFQPQEGPLLLFYKVGPSPSGWWGVLVTSQDGGKTWSQPHRLGQDRALGNENPNLLGPVKNKPIQLADGAILCPSSSEHDGWRVHFEVTRDLGKSWQVIGPIEDARTFNAIQPAILVHPQGQLQVVCRSREGAVVQSRSEDGGKTWRPLSAAALPNPNAGLDALTLADGRHLLVYNHTTRQSSFPSGRNMLNVAISSDGASWTPVLTLERSAGEFSYPAVIQAADGKVHITYTWKRQSVKHVVLDPRAIR
jgi:predicted neuraminidase